MFPHETSRFAVRQMSPEDWRAAIYSAAEPWISWLRQWPAERRIFRNVAANRGHWLIVRALDPRLNRDAYGAEIRVKAAEQPMIRVVNPGDSFQSSSDPRAHFGLGKATHYEEIHLLWPDGLSEVFPGGEADRYLVLRRGEGRAEAVSPAK